MCRVLEREKERFNFNQSFFGNWLGTISVDKGTNCRNISNLCKLAPAEAFLAGWREGGRLDRVWGQLGRRGRGWPPWHRRSRRTCRTPSSRIQFFETCSRCYTLFLYFSRRDKITWSVCRQHFFQDILIFAWKARGRIHNPLFST